MIKKYIQFQNFILTISIIFFSCNQNDDTHSYNQNDIESKFHELNGPYLGQKPPGMMAEIFAPGLLSAGGSENSITFSPDGMAFIYPVVAPERPNLAKPKGVFQGGYQMYSHNEKGYWTEPKEFSLTSDCRELLPFFSPDGKRIYFNYSGDQTKLPNKSISRMWYVERQNDGLSRPIEIHFGKDYKGNSGVFPTVASNNNLYFASFPDRTKGYIYVSKYENDKYSLPEKLSNAINDFGGNHPYIAPDESYIIFDSNRTENNFGESDLYISFRDKYGKWIKAQNLGERVNTVYDERRAFASFDGKYLFFISDRINPQLPNKPITLKKIQRLINVPANGNQHIYWIDARIIEKLRPKN